MSIFIYVMVAIGFYLHSIETDRESRLAIAIAAASWPVALGMWVSKLDDRIGKEDFSTPTDKGTDT